jgi:hypothetical protein
MKKIIAIIALVSTTYGITAQSQKLTVKEDVFIQGGDTSDTAFGETKPKGLFVYKSHAGSKYSRITYLKFETPKKLKSVKKVTLHIPLKVFPNKNTDAPFTLDVHAVENDRWRESSITWSDALELGELVASIEVEQGDKVQRLAIELDAKIISNLFDGKKDRNITLALYNSKFNSVSAMAPSKESNIKNASYLVIE